MHKFSLRILVVLLLALTILSTSTAFASDTGTAGSPVTFSPTEINSVLNNPYMGWAPWASGGPYSQPHRLVYVNATWRELEPTKGNYAFDALEAENKFSYWAGKGVKVILRINMDYPESTSHKDIPDWLYNEINGDGTWYDIDWGKGFSPNYNNPKLIAYHKTLVAALAARYNNDSRVPMIALGSLGQWGEFHTKKSDSFTIPFPKENVTDQYVQAYVDSFRNKILLMRRPFQIAKNNNMGLFNDSFGSMSQTYGDFVDHINNGYLDWLTNERHPAMPDYWKTAPSGGEFANYPGLTYLEDSNMSTTLKMVQDSHTSWLGPCSPATQPAGTSLQKNFDRMLTTMGYRFVLQSVTHQSSAVPGENVPVAMNWANKGVAPFYYNWPLELSLVDASGNVAAKTVSSEDIRTWLPGSRQVGASVDIPAGLAAGTYTLCAAILDPETGLPGIDLAIDGRRSDGRYALSSISVSQPAPVLEAATVEVSGSTYVEVPQTGVVYSDYTATVKDQNGTVMPGESVTWSLSKEIKGLTLSADGSLTVNNTTAAGNLTLTATSRSNGTVKAVKDLILYAKPAAAPTTLEISGSTYVEVPQAGVIYSDYNAAVKDQNGTVMPGEAVTWSLGTEVKGVTLSPSGSLTVDTSAVPGNLTLIAASSSNGSVKAVKDLILYAKPAAAPTTLEISGATYIKIPTRNVTYSDYKATITDQYGAVMGREAVTWSLSDMPSGVTLNAETGKMIVSIDTQPCTLTLTAVSNSNSSLTLTKSLILIK